jgi:SAM-dependent methyltransferase
MGAASFRDPGGRVVIRDGRVLREVNPAGLACLDAALDSAAARSEIERGRFVKSTLISRDDSGATLEHEAIPFPSFPYEWPPEMLYEAGALTLDLALALAAEGRGLKDATPFNVLYRGSQPVFVDILSVEQRDPLDPLWLARAQFIRTFVLPLAAERDFGIPLSQSLLQREGIEPEEFYRLLPAPARLRPKYLSLVSMPVWLGEKGKARQKDDTSIYQPRHVNDKEKAVYILRGTLRGLRKSLNRFAPVQRQSRWSDYMAADCSYTREQFAEKEAYVGEILRDFPLGFPKRRVLDVGANTGHFSAMAAQAGASVVALDSDPAVAGQIWRRARAENLDILPLVVNLAQPTPASGWRNQECPSFLDRATGVSGRDKFELVMMLAVIHHMLATERVPLPEIIDLAADLTRDFALIEFVDCEDPMFRRLSRGRDALYAHLHADLFEQCAAERFEIVRQRAITGSKRTLYLLQKKQR